MKLSTNSDWTFQDLIDYDKAISEIAFDYMGLDTYKNQIEVISSSQMQEAYASIGLPVTYSHWSIGQELIDLEQRYNAGQMGLAYEIVINSNPCLSYLMEENSLSMQALVIAHACYGHNAVFKNNYLFKEYTNADTIFDYMIFARNYISECEEKYGVPAVESFLDACHALKNHGVFKYKRPDHLSQEQLRKSQHEKMIEKEKSFNFLLDSTIHNEPQNKAKMNPEENLLYFFEKNAPNLETWQREIIRIVRKIAEYFYPQMQTKVINEGFATFTHYTILNEMNRRGQISDNFLIDCISSHTNVIFQPDFDSPYYNGSMNPYTLGFNIFRDIRRICETPTKEDEKWFPHIAGQNWVNIVKEVMYNHKDQSFIHNFLSPKVIRDMKLFSVERDTTKQYVEISAIHNDEGYEHIREMLSDQYESNAIIPNLEIIEANLDSDRTLVIRHSICNNILLNKDSVNKTLYLLQRIWQYPIILESYNTNTKQVIQTFKT